MNMYPLVTNFSTEDIFPPQQNPQIDAGMIEVGPWDLCEHQEEVSYPAWGVKTGSPDEDRSGKGSE